jgi:DNA-binding CsgD family transcriptional regulator
MVAEGVGAAIDSVPGLALLASVTTAAEAERHGARVDAAALDAGLPGVKELASRLRRQGVRVVILGDPADEDEGIRVPLASPVAALAAALAPELGVPSSSGGRLTPQQQRILTLVASGLTAKQVARTLGISPKTVEQHKSHIFTKLKVPNQAAAIRVALGRGLQRSPA